MDEEITIVKLAPAKELVPPQTIKETIAGLQNAEVKQLYSGNSEEILPIKVLVGFDKEKRITPHGITSFVDVGSLREMKGVEVFDVNNEKVDIENCEDDYLANKNIGRITINGADYRVEVDAWLDPGLYPCNREKGFEDKNYKETVEDLFLQGIELWSRVVEGGAVDDKVREILGEGRGNQIIKVVDYFAVHKGVFRVMDSWIANFDLDDLVKKFDNVEALEKYLRSSGPSEKRIPFHLINEPDGEALMSAAKKKFLGEDLNNEERDLINCVPWIKLARSKSADSSATFNEVDETTRNIILANVTEHFMIKMKAGDQIMARHRENYNIFSKSLYGEYPWLTGINSDAIRYSLGKDTFHGNAANLFLSLGLDKEGMVQVADHERIHQIKAELASHIPSSVKPSGERHGEVYTETLKLMIEARGDASLARQLMTAHGTYNRGVYVMFDLIEEIEMKGETGVGARLLLEGMDRVAKGETRNEEKVFEDYYDNLAGEEGAYAASLRKYEDIRMFRTGRSEGKKEDFSEIGEILNQVIDGYTFEEMKEVVPKGVYVDEHNFGDSKRRVASKLVSWGADQLFTNLSTDYYITGLRHKIMQNEVLSGFFKTQLLKEYKANLDKVKANFESSLR